MKLSKNSKKTEQALEKSNRVEWIDTAKGIGILLVVIGHIQNGVKSDEGFKYYIYLFHMPLFFILSGMTYRPKPLKTGPLRKFNSLMVPYLSFFVLLLGLTLAIQLISLQSFNVTSAKELIWTAEHQIHNLLVGGRALTGNFGVFWFIPVLFMVLVLADLIFAFKKNTSLTIASLTLIGVLSAPWVSSVVGDAHIPWLINAVPIAFSFFGAGYFLARPALQTNWNIIVAAVFTCFCLSTYGVLGIPSTINMKYGDFGPLILGPGLAVALSIVLMWACRMSPNSFLNFLGKRSMTVMYLHPIVLMQAGQHDLSWLLALPIAILFPILCHWLFEQQALGKRLFLGRVE